MNDATLGTSVYVLVCGLPVQDDLIPITDFISIKRLENPLTVFDLAAVGAVGFREWAMLEPISSAATCEIICTAHAEAQGYNSLNRCWLLSALLLLRGFSRHICPAVSSYSWNHVAGRQAKSREKQNEELPLQRFQGGILDFHLSVLAPRETSSSVLSLSDGKWIAEQYNSFELLAATNEKFRFALEASIDWRYTKDMRIAISRIWSGIEALFGISTELVFRISLYAAVLIEERGDKRIHMFKKVKSLYNIRSKAVHGEPIENEKLLEGMNGSFQILRELLFSCIKRGKVPNEQEIYPLLLG